jgi:hypothetical protein
MPSTVSDTFAFACARREAWEIIHSEPKAHLGLEDDSQLRAFDAAKHHVEASKVALLLATWNAFVERARAVKNTTRYDSLMDRAPDSRTLAKSASWSKQLVFTRGKELSVGASIEPDRLGETYALYAYIDAPEGHLDALEALLDPEPRYRVRADTYLYISEQALKEGEVYADLAARLVEDAWPVVERASVLLSPPRGQKGKGE